MSASVWLYSRNNSPSSAPESPRATSWRTWSRSRLARSSREVVAGLVIGDPLSGDVGQDNGFKSVRRGGRPSHYRNDMVGIAPGHPFGCPRLKPVFKIF